MQRSVEGLRITPWADWSEWWELREMLASGNVYVANERVQCYLVRRRQAVPVAMVTTVGLQYMLNYPSPDEYSQRLGLAMALVRFVNGMTDRLQPRGERAFAKSVHSLSVELKLPLILVEIRHQASHNNLPRLTALESGARKALEWLEEYYWDAQYQKIRHHLANSPIGLKHIFMRESESDAPSVDTTLWVEESQNDEALAGMTKEDDGSVLRRLKELSDGIMKRTRGRKKELRVESESLQTSDSQWSECGNSQAWKVTPIGLLPGQKRPPRWPTMSAEASNDNASRALGLQETPALNSAEVEAHNPVSPKFVEPAWKCIKHLSPRDTERVEEMTSYYEKLLKAHPST